MATVERYNKDNADDIKSGVKGRAIHILANDPDADRLAVAEFSERFVANQSFEKTIAKFRLFAIYIRFHNSMTNSNKPKSHENHKSCSLASHFDWISG